MSPADVAVINRRISHHENQKQLLLGLKKHQRGDRLKLAELSIRNLKRWLKEADVQN